MFIDLHTHGIAGYDTRSVVPEDYLKMAEAMKAHGTGAFVPTLFPGPVADMRAQMAAVKAAIEAQRRISPSPSSPPIKGGEKNGIPSPLAGEGEGGGDYARILGVHLEGPFVNPKKEGALGGANFIPPTDDNLSRLVEGFEDIIRIMTIAPELPGALKLIERLSCMGVRVNMGHSDATYAQAADGRRAGATGVTHLFNAMSGIHHREPGLAGYAMADDALYVEVIADFAHVSPEMLRLVLKCKQPGRIILVSDSLGPAKTKGVPEKGPMYMPDGTTLAGSGICLTDAVENIASLGVPLETARLFASVNPQNYLKG